MKYLRHLALSLLLVLSLATSAFAAEVPDSFVVENLNGQQRLVKTYTLAPDIDPDTLKEPSFEYDGFLYTWAYTTKEDHSFLERKEVVELVTVETAKKDLGVVLAELAPTIQYDDGGFSGELALDHTTLKTEAAGYTTKYGKVTETKVIGNLDRNDMSYVPATTIKNGMTLSLANVDWQVTGTALVGEALVPSQYQAVATYSASSSYKAATGYITTAEYHGEVTSEGIDSITYTVVFTGTEIIPPDSGHITVPASKLVLAVMIVLATALLGGLVAFLFYHRKNVFVYIPGEKPNDYKLIAKSRADPKAPTVDLSELDPYPTGKVAIELKHALAKKLLGKEFTVICKIGPHSYIVRQDRPGDWHEFDITSLREETT